MKDKNLGGYVHERIARFYDYVPTYAMRGDTEFYVGHAVESRGPVLELGCGTGRVLLPIARAGVEITGLDFAEPMLAVLREKLEREDHDVRKRVTLVQADMCQFELGKTFALIIMPFRPFQHLVSVQDQLACLQCANRHLAMDGKLVFDLFQTNPGRMYDPVYKKESQDFDGVELPDGTKLRRTHLTVAFHRAEQYNDIEMIYYVMHPDGRTERLVQAFPFRYFFRYEAEHLLARCGFAVANLYGNFDRSPLADDSPEMIFVAEKSGDVIQNQLKE